MVLLGALRRNRRARRRQLQLPSAHIGPSGRRQHPPTSVSKGNFFFFQLVVITLIAFLFDALTSVSAATSTTTADNLTSHHRELVPRRQVQKQHHITNQLAPASQARFRGISSQRPSSVADLVLADTVVLTTVEGGLLALDRKTGRQLWSLSPHSSHSSDSLLRPLVTALYGKEQKSFAEIAQGTRSFESTFGAGSMPELEAGGIYIVEPSSAGDIYVLSSANSKKGTRSTSNPDADQQPNVQLDKLPLTLPQLVELSPFSFAGDDTRVFVGQKQTTMVELDIHSGELGAVFGGRQGGVWCGAQTRDTDPLTEGPGPSAEACIDDEPTLGGSSSKPASQLAYIGRTDYTLNIHSRSSPEALQTLHFSTFAPNAGDRDVQALWMQANHPDQRAIMGMPEDGSVICFNLSDSRVDSSGSHASDDEDETSRRQAQTLWTSDVRASVAGIFDVVYPAAHLQNTKSLTRPILVQHPPVPLHRIFPQIGDATSKPHTETGFDASGPRRRSAYLGIAGDSLFAMSANRFPLVAFTSRALAGLPAGSSSDDALPASDPRWPSQLPPSGSNWANERKCASFGCWLGSYSLEVDTSAEGRLRDTLLLGAGHSLEIDDGGPRLAIGDRPAFPTTENDTRGGSRSQASVPSQANDPQKRSKDGQHHASKRPGSRPDSRNFDSAESKDGGYGSTDDSASDTVRAQIKQASRSWKSKLGIILLQVIGVLIISILAGATYLGLQEQKIRTEQQAKAIAQGVVWIPVLKEDEAGFGGDAAAAEKLRQEEERQLVDAIELSKKDAAHTTVSHSADANGVGSSRASIRPVPNLSEEDEAQEEKTNGSASASKKKNNKRRRRGKRGGAAVAAKAARAGGSKESGSPEGEGEEEEDGEEADGAEDGEGNNVLPTSTKTELESIKSNANTRGQDQGRGTQARRRQDSASAESSSSNGNEPDTPKTNPQFLESTSKHNIRPKATSVQKASDSLQRAQDLMSPQPKSPLLGSGWDDVAEDDAASVGRAAAQIAAGANSRSGNLHVSTSSLTISDEVLGYGSSGTVVFKGTFQGRAVAVKRLLRDFVHVASKEVSLLESADNHPNVIRYFYKELTPSFLFIALELCPASLAEVVEKPADYRDLSNLLDPKRALQQITSGLRHLHSLSIVHRDIKPQNILVATSASGKSLKMLLSDFGLSKRLDGMAQTSFSQTVNNPGGTVGWRAPEILRGDVNLDAGSESESSIGNNNPNRGSAKEEKQRLTRAVDIFALGCLAYYVLSNGDHPFGSRFEREMNIIRKRVDLARLDGLGEEGHEAQDLILKMVSHEPRHRPSAAEVLTHPYFWDSNKRLNFLQDASDRFEIMEKDPPVAALVLLESKAKSVLGTDWHRRCDKLFLENLGKFRKYDPSSVQDLLRAMRNKKHHYQDMPPSLKKVLGALPDGYLNYFTRRFPELFLHVYNTIVQQPLIRTEPVFREYFNCTEPEH